MADSPLLDKLQNGQEKVPAEGELKFKTVTLQELAEAFAELKKEQEKDEHDNS